VNLARRAWCTGRVDRLVQILQAVRHRHEHQEQICSALTALGLEPPDLSGLAWGHATGDVTG
jgi:hypothetical protein